MFFNPIFNHHACMACCISIMFFYGMLCHECKTRKSISENLYGEIKKMNANHECLWRPWPSSN